MSKIRDLVEKIPFIAECVDADRFSVRNLLVYDKEIAEPESVFAYREGDNDRTAVLEIPERYIGNKENYDYGMERLRIAVLSQDKREGRITADQQEELDRLTTKHTAEVWNESVDEVLTVEAATRDIWS